MTVFFNSPCYLSNRFNMLSIQNLCKNYARIIAKLGFWFRTA